MTTISTLIFVTIIDGIFNLLAIVHVAAVIAEFYYYAHLVDELEDKVHNSTFAGLRTFSNSFASSAT